MNKSPSGVQKQLVQATDANVLLLGMNLPMNLAEYAEDFAKMYLRIGADSQRWHAPDARRPCAPCPECDPSADFEALDRKPSHPAYKSAQWALAAPYEHTREDQHHAPERPEMNLEPKLKKADGAGSAAIGVGLVGYGIFGGFNHEWVRYSTLAVGAVLLLGGFGGT